MNSPSIKILAFLCLFISFNSAVYAQGIAWDTEVLSEVDYALNHRNSKLHSSFRPFIPGFEKEYFSLLDSSVVAAEESTSSIKLEPLLNLRAGLAATQGNYQAALNSFAGARMTFHVKDKFYTDISYAHVFQQMPGFYRAYIDSLNVLHSLDHTTKLFGGHQSHYYVGRMNYNAGKHFSFEAGRDKNFWGDGYRSLILSDNASPYPYFKITTKVWHVKYINLWARMKDISSGYNSKARYKNLALHGLSWDVTKRLNVSLFEMVVFQSTDSLSKRNMDLAYANPIIFYRPVEYSRGSADNVLIGFGLKWKITNRHQVYGQLLLDEFVLNEYRQNHNWWANKYGIQFGFKIFDNVIDGLHLQSEWNIARPFTYTHGSVLQNYGHMNENLAHPLGTNFLEWVTHLKYHGKKWTLHEEFIWAIYGRDENGENLGGNIFQSYKFPTKAYDNYWAQGLKSTYHYNRLTWSKKIFPKYDFNFDVSYIIRYEKNDLLKSTDHYIMFGLRTTGLNIKRDY